MATLGDLGIAAAAIVGALALSLSGVSKLPTVTDPVLDTWPALGPGEGAILFAGDNLLGDASGTFMREHGDDWQFRKVRSLLKTAGAAAVVINQEGPVTTHRKRNRPNPVYNYHQPPRTMKLFKNEGITHMCVANNHALDRHLKGLLDTIKHADAVGIQTFGGGRNASDARRPVVIDVNGTKVAIVCASQNWGSLRKAGWEAKGKEGGIFLMRDDLLPKVTARARKAADLVVWYPHWGGNYTPVARGQRRLAKKIMAAGADAIVGHHSHDAQTFGHVDGKPVAWSLGNLVFGTPGRFGMDKYGEGFGLLMRMVIKDGAIDRYEFIPMQINNRINEYQPYPLTASRAREVLKKYAHREGTTIRFDKGIGILDARP